MKTQQTLDQILYGDGTYVSAIPVLVGSVLSDALENLVERLVKKINRQR